MKDERRKQPKIDAASGVCLILHPSSFILPKMDYEVELETFRGPLDLLLYLVKRDEVDVLDIPIARVAEQFRRHLDVVLAIDVEGAGDFLVMAATLMEIKSKM